MFEAPEVIETEVFARVPDRLRVRDRASWMSRNRHGDFIDSFLEGPGFDRAGNLYVVDLAHGRIFRITPAGGFSVAAEYDGRPNGLRVRSDGRIFVADRARGIVTLDPGSGTVETVLASLPNGARFKGPNDLIFARNGDLYFTDQGETGLHDPTGRLVRLRASGQVDVLLDRVPSPNGLALNKAETAILLAVTRDNAIWHVPLLDGGEHVGRVGRFIQMSGGPGGGPDGIIMDEADNLVVAHAQMGAVWVFNRRGEPRYRIRSCEGAMTTNVAHGGPDRKTLYITESATGTILTARLPVAGVVPHSHL